jgi:hypothetical protein
LYPWWAGSPQLFHFLPGRPKPISLARRGPCVECAGVRLHPTGHHRLRAIAMKSRENQGTARNFILPLSPVYFVRSANCAFSYSPWRGRLADSLHIAGRRSPRCNKTAYLWRVSSIDMRVDRLLEP